MTDDATGLLNGGILARAAATGVAGAALSVDRHPTAMRCLGLLLAAGAGGAAALVARGHLPTDTETDGPAGGSAASEPPMGPVAAAALGVGVFAATAGVSEAGLRTQRGFERWAARTNGHPRLTVGMLSAALSLGIDLAERAASRRQPSATER